ncbi:TerD family protein [Gordonia sp. NPDC057258]|uniref:TerD family protein n=1 Tax=unclassified Gordonia (in: high G+C Gram-positive bacteria) TaxID=2657482 RepID=UPI003640A712
MELRELSKGGNVSVDEVAGENSPRLVVVIQTEAAAGKEIGLDAGILILGDDGQVRSNDDLIFYNQPTGVGGAVRLVSHEVHQQDPDGSSFSQKDAVEVDLARIPDSVARIMVTASTDPRTDASFGDAELVNMYVAHADEPDAPFVVHAMEGLSSERALIFGEIYRRNDAWKIRAVGQGYDGGLEALVSDHGIEVDDTESVDGSLDSTGEDEEPDTEQNVAGSVPDASSAEAALAADTGMPGADDAVQETAPSLSEPGTKVSIGRKRRPAPLPKDWASRTLAYLPRQVESEWKRARLFPSAGIKSAAEQEMRTTSILLATMETVPEFGRAVLSQTGAPRGRIEAFTEVRFSMSGEDVRPDGLIKVSRGSKVWRALVEVKTGRAELTGDQVGTYLKLAKAKSFDAVITISGDLMASPDLHPFAVESRPSKNIVLKHLSWEEILAEAMIVHEHVGVGDRVRARLLEELLWYAADSQSGMRTFDDMGKQWVKIREAVKNKTVGASDDSTSDVCDRFDRLARHVALRLSALTGQRVTAQAPASRVDSVSRARQLADSGELFALLRVSGAAGPVAMHADLGRGRIGCSLKTAAPRAGRPQTKINWLVRQLSGAPEDLRITAHHAGSRVESTAALLKDIRVDATSVMPTDGRDIREFTVTIESSMGSKRSGSEGGFVTAMVLLTTTFYAEVVERVRSGRDA